MRNTYKFITQGSSVAREQRFLYTCDVILDEVTVSLTCPQAAMTDSVRTHLPSPTAFFVPAQKALGSASVTAGMLTY